MTDPDPKISSWTELLGDGALLHPLVENIIDHQRWLDHELCSLVELQLGVLLDPATFTVQSRRDWTARLPGSIRLPAPSRSIPGRCWLLHDGLEVGTLCVNWHEWSRFVHLSSLYVHSAHRHQGLGKAAIDVVEVEALRVGIDGITLEVYWTDPRAPGWYLRQGFWLRMWKDALRLQRCSYLPLHRIDIEGDRATFSILRDGVVLPLIHGERQGGWLGWEETSFMEEIKAEPGMIDIRLAAAPTFALALALEGWPIRRSPAAVQQGLREMDIGGPEWLARRIEWEEAICREQGRLITAPRIPGLVYPDLAALREETIALWQSGA